MESVAFQETAAIFNQHAESAHPDIFHQLIKYFLSKEKMKKIVSDFIDSMFDWEIIC